MVPALKKTMELRKGYFCLGGEPFFPYSGEIHYFRVLKKDWRSRLKALKAAGFNTVSTYLPWNWHEPEEGKFDFTGVTHPERDVLGFMAAAQKEGLRFFARVGPVSNGELTNGGIPDWLLKNYPQTFIGGREGGPVVDVPLMSYLEPTFQEKVGRWYDAVLPDVSRRQVQHGGPVIGVQLCNEIALFQWLFKCADDRPHVDGLYRDFLKGKYGAIEALNRAYGTSYADFAALRQPKADNVALDKTLPVFVDWTLFYRRYFAAYYLTLSSRARKHGITVPLFCNIPQFYDYDIRGRGNWAPMTTSLFRDFPLLTPNLIFGGAYQMRHLDFENFHDVALTTEVTRLLGTCTVEKAPEGYGTPDPLPALPPFQVHAEAQVPVVCAEMQTGIMWDRPRLYPQQVLLNVKSSVGQGLAGVNAYMFAGGVNPRGFGAFGDYHDWQSPISAEGEKRPHLAPLADFGRFLKWAGPLLSPAAKAVDVTFGFYLPYYATEYLSGPFVDRIQGQRTELWYDGLARLAQLAGYSFNFVDLQRTPLDVLRQVPSLWVYSFEFMDAETQKKLAEYARAGGKLVLYPQAPALDLKGEKETALADELGLGPAAEAKGKMLPLDGKEYWVPGPIRLFAVEKGDRALAPMEGRAAVLVKSAGRGEALVIGFALPHKFDHYRHWVRSWGEALGLKPRVQCDPWDVQASLREKDDYGFLFVHNYHFIPREAVVSLTAPNGEKLRLPRRGRLSLEGLSSVILPLNVPLAPGRRLVYATAELRDARARDRGLELVFQTLPGRTFEVQLALDKKPRAVKFQGRKVRGQWKAGRLFIQLRADGPAGTFTVGF